MKKILVMIVLLTVGLVQSQTQTSLQQDIFFTQGLDPSLSLGETYISSTYSVDAYKIGANVNVNTKYDSFDLGLYTEQNRAGSIYDAYLSKNAGRFIGTIHIRYYDLLEQSGTGGGFSAAYKFDNGTIGVNVLDLYDVTDRETDRGFEMYGGVTPQLFANFKVLEVDGAVFNMTSLVKYNSYIGVVVEGSAEMDIDGLTIGVGRSDGDLFGYTKKEWKNIGLFFSMGQQLNFGLTLRR